MTGLRQQSWRFLLVGGSNTIDHRSSCSPCSRSFIDPSVAYTIVFAAGLAYTTALTGRFVFSAEGVARPRAPRSCCGTSASYLVGLLVVHLRRPDGDRSGLVVAVAVVAVTAPLTSRRPAHLSPLAAGRRR